MLCYYNIYTILLLNIVHVIIVIKCDLFIFFLFLIVYSNYQINTKKLWLNLTARM